MPRFSVFICMYKNIGPIQWKVRNWVCSMYPQGLAYVLLANIYDKPIYIHVHTDCMLSLVLSSGGYPTRDNDHLQNSKGSASEARVCVWPPCSETHCLLLVKAVSKLKKRLGVRRLDKNPDVHKLFFYKTCSSCFVFFESSYDQTLCRVDISASIRIPCSAMLSGCVSHSDTDQAGYYRSLSIREFQHSAAALCCYRFSISHMSVSHLPANLHLVYVRRHLVKHAKLVGYAWNSCNRS